LLTESVRTMATDDDDDIRHRKLQMVNPSRRYPSSHPTKDNTNDDASAKMPRRKHLLTKRQFLKLVLAVIACTQLFRLDIFSFKPKTPTLKKTTSLKPNPTRSDTVPLKPKVQLVDDGAPKVLMVSYLFGEKAVQKKYLRLFVESARWSGINLLLLGDHPIPFPLPDNVKHFLVSWDSFLHRIEENVLNGQKFVNLYQSKNYYKVVDFKPLFPVLFPELVDGYAWWGHLDNDMILGNARQFFTPEILNNYDIISPLKKKYTWGPFMLYRNTPLINELFRKAERPLSEIFDSYEAQMFDEWGSDMRIHYNSTMSGLVELYRERLGIRWKGGDIPIVWDGDCTNRTENFQGCCTCHLHPPKPFSTLQERYQHTLLSMGECGFYRGALFPALICHFQYTKDGFEHSLANEKYVSTLIEHGPFAINFENASGFYPE